MRAIVAERLNSRFREGGPSESLLSAGVLLHQFDGLLFDVDRTGKPWQQRTFFSAHLINRKLPALPSGQIPLFSQTGAGVVLAPSARVSCAYHADGMSASRTCHLAELNSSSRRCVEGCWSPGGPDWCDEKRQISLNWHRPADACAWPPSKLAQMLRAQTQQPAHYNEVVVDGKQWETELPTSIEAVFFLRSDVQRNRTSRTAVYDGRRLAAATSFSGRLTLRHRSPPRECLGPKHLLYSKECSRARAEVKARYLHSNLLSYFKLQASMLPLLELNPFSWVNPFSSVHTVSSPTA
ncbi:hypothetical protein AB1Y20_020522 [Prymnesium parvum]|uniref:Tubulin--tyrosine ligase-like protein 9 n=1 Tax=Prymnesium parvum TaxID=97485 RepID=A0AB34JXN1_PRYPA